MFISLFPPSAIEIQSSLPYVEYIMPHLRAENHPEISENSRDFKVYLPLVATASPVADVVEGIRVSSTTGQDVKGCGSRATPCRSIQYAINQSQCGDTILVAGGTYTYNPSTDIFNQLGNTGVIIVVNKVLTILGGYDPNNWYMADPDQFKTIIDGENAYRGVYVLKTNSPTDLHMEGFTIQNGLGLADRNRLGNDGIFGFGGGMLVEGAGLTLKDIVFKNNRAVGVTTSSTYGGSGSGGGLAVRNPPSLIRLKNILFEENRAEGGRGPERGGLALGGGLYTYQSAVLGENITFVNNVAVAANTNGDGYSANLHADAQGGAAAFQRGSVVTLRTARAIGNIARGGDALQGNPGGAFGGAFFTENADLALYDGFVSDNLARGGDGINDGSTPGAGYARGGGIATANGEVLIIRTSVINNTSRGGDGQVRMGSASGGGIGSVRYVGDYLVKITNSVIAGNLAQLGNGTKVVGGGGGGIWLQGTEACIHHTTFARNRVSSSSMQGQAILLLADAAPTPSTADIYYSIIADHTNDMGVAAVHSKLNDSNTSNMANLYQGLWACNSKDINPEGRFTGLSTMIEANSAGFVSPGYPDYDYHIQGTSAAKDRATGSPTGSDIDYQIRPTGGSSDIGADEYVP
jgi:hypothetical protein